MFSTWLRPRPREMVSGDCGKQSRLEHWNQLMFSFNDTMTSWSFQWEYLPGSLCRSIYGRVPLNIMASLLPFEINHSRVTHYVPSTLPSVREIPKSTWLHLANPSWVWTMSTRKNFIFLTNNFIRKKTRQSQQKKQLSPRAFEWPFLDWTYASMVQTPCLAAERNDRLSFEHHGRIPIYFKVQFYLPFSCFL